MPVHVIVGASRGLGYGILKYFAQDPANTVIGIVRNPGPTQAQLEKDGLSDKTTLLTGDLTNYASLVACAEKISQLANGAIDYLWNNGAYLNEKTSEVFFTEWNDSNYSDFLAELRHGYETNVIGVINSINAFLPLVLKSSIKKVITISSGHGDVNLIRDFGVWEAPAYSVEKAALNAVVAKYDARYRGDGVLFLSLSPGVVDTGHAFSETSELPGKFFKYSKAMKVLQPQESVEAMWKVVEECVPDQDGGQFYSHLGRHQRWL